MQQVPFIQVTHTKQPALYWQSETNALLHVHDRSAQHMYTGKRCVLC